MDIPASRILGMLAGVLIFLVGFFVYKAKPDSPMHRLFFAFAAADGVSSFCYDLALSPGLPAFQMHAYLFYVHSFLAFFGLLVCFGLVFPRPIVSNRARVPVLGAVAATVLAFIAWHALRPEAFWIGRYIDGQLVFQYTSLGLFVVSAYVATTAALVTRILALLLIEPSPTHRRQAAFVLGAMALGYTPYATTTFVEAMRLGLSVTIFGPSLPVAAVYATSALAVLAILIAAGTLLLDGGAERRDDRRVVLTALAGVTVLTVAAVVFPGRATSDLLQILGLVAYPLLLAYAIARYEILDIGPTVKRTAFISLATSVLAVAFFLGEAVLENVLEARFAGAVGVPVLAAVFATFATVAVFAPLSRLSTRVARRIAPDLTPSLKRDRQLEIYRHGLEAAVVDGTLDPREVKVLARLREALGVTMDDHEALLREISSRRGPFA